MVSHKVRCMIYSFPDLLPQLYYNVVSIILESDIQNVLRQSSAMAANLYISPICPRTTNHALLLCNVTGPDVEQFIMSISVTWKLHQA